MAVPAAQSVSHATPFDRSELVRKICSNKTTLDNSKILQTIFTIFLYSSLIKTSIVYHVQTFKSFVEKYIDINHIQFLMFSNNANNDLSSPPFNICHVIYRIIPFRTCHHIDPLPETKTRRRRDNNLISADLFPNIVEPLLTR